MPQFRYTAVDAGGRLVKGLLEAESRTALVERLQDQGQVPLSAVPADQRNPLRRLAGTSLLPDQGLSKRAVAEFTRELAVMLGAGQDLDHALRFAVEITTASRAHAIFSDVRDKVRGGATLGAALSAHPATFSRLYVGMVTAGEAGGTLAESLDRLADLLEREWRLAVRVQSALVYPAVLVVAAFAVITLLLVYVLPQFTPIFVQAGAKLPAATRALISLGEIARDDGIWGLVVVLAGALAARRLLQSRRPRLRFDRALLALPVVGELVRQREAARLTRTLGSLLKNGVSLLAALSVSKGVLTNRAVAEAVEQAEARAKQGAGLSHPLEAARVFPQRMIHLLRLGEETGRLAEMALRAADIHDDQVQTSLQRLTSLIVPAVTIVTGLAVAGIIASLVTAMLSLNDLAL
jgi:general secretion pathway protein F